MKTIELEIRSEIPIHQTGNLKARLQKYGKTLSKTKRCFVMFAGKIHGKQYDIRVRVTNGEVEVVIKKGGLHAHDRIEHSQPIQKSEMIGMVRVFSLLGLEAKVGERETVNYDFGKETTVSLVQAGKIAYLEIERMTDPKNLSKDRAELYELLRDLGYKLLDKSGFYDLCHRLTEHTDWIFKGQPNDLKKLANVLRKY